VKTSLLAHPLRLAVLITAGLFAVGLGVNLILDHSGRNGDRWLAAATEDARAWASDAELVALRGTYVRQDGWSDVPAGGRWSFNFRSPAREQAASTSGGPKGIVHPACAYAYEVSPSTTRRGQASYREGGREDSPKAGCGSSLPSPPRCSIAEVWRRAMSGGAPAAALADISLTTTGTSRAWLFETFDRSPRDPVAEHFHIPASAPRFSLKFADDCP
jgi:hypothetical protein